MKADSHENETKKVSKEGKNTTKKETEREKSDGNKSFKLEKIKSVPALEALIANRFCEVTLGLR